MATHDTDSVGLLEAIERADESKRAALLGRGALRDAPVLPTRTEHTRTRIRKTRPRVFKIVIATALFLVAARLALPHVVKHVLNDRLANLDGYAGHVDDVDIALYRGAYRLEGMRIVKTGGDVPVPFFSAPEIDISVEWMALLDGKVVAEVVIDRPEMNFVTAGGGSDAQMGQENDWRATVDEMVPLTINRLEVRGGEIHYRDFGASPEVDLRLDRLALVARNLSTERREGEEMPARIHIDARVQRSGRLVADARLDPWNEQPTFSLALRLRDLPATELNRFLRAYAGVDAEAGVFFLYAQVAAHRGRFHGIVKPIAEGLSLFRLDEDGGFFDVLGDAIVGLIAEVFENQGTDRLGTRVPISGTFESPVTDGWAAVGAVLSNAFIRAIRHGFDEFASSRPNIAR